MTWSEFKDNLVTKYDYPATPAATLINLSNGKLKEVKSLAAYFSRRLAFTTDIDGRNKFQRELLALSFLRRKHVNTHNDVPENKQLKLTTPQLLLLVLLVWKTLIASVKAITRADALK
ncbi:hypothetical protein ACJJTC_013608 [Scirpophaga incertulas]